MDQLALVIVCIMKESYKRIVMLRSSSLHQRLMVKFNGEEGIDSGGLARSTTCHMVEANKYTSFN